MNWDAHASVARILPTIIPALAMVLPAGTSLASSGREPQQMVISQSSVQVFAATGERTTVPAIAAVAVQLAPWAEAVLEKVDAYETVKDGWRGDGSKAPSTDVLDQTRVFIRSVAAEMPHVAAPVVGMDDDGTGTLFWNQPAMMAAVSIYGDGTFSFYAEGFETTARSDSQKVDSPLPAELIRAMTGSLEYDIERWLAA